MFKNKIILITGGSGSWGNELTSQLLSKGVKEIRIFSRGEISQVAMQRKFLNPKLKFIIGDVRDLDSLTEACKEVDFIYHLAALKHVPICNEWVLEAIKTNILGTVNVVKAAINNKVKKVIDVSTDKACSPLNLYGMTKAIGEKLILNADKTSDYTRFVVIRGGNALGSNGSVVPHFINQIKTQNKVEITDIEMTRYFLTLPEAVGLLITATKARYTGGIFVMKMPSFKIVDIAKKLIEKYGNPSTKIEIIGVREGEKLHEVLVSEYESKDTHLYGSKYYYIGKNSTWPKVEFKEYTSNSDLKGDKEIEELLTKGNF